MPNLTPPKKAPQKPTLDVNREKILKWYNVFGHRKIGQFFIEKSQVLVKKKKKLNFCLKVSFSHIYPCFSRYPTNTRS